MSVVLNILSKLDDRGIARAQKRLAELGSQAKGFKGSVAADMIRAGASVERFGDRVARTGDRMTTRFTLPVVAGFGLMTKMAIDEGKEMALLEQALRNNTDATDEQVAAVERWITKTQNATGVADGELRPAMAALLAVTKDTAEAQDLMSTALDIAAAKGKPVTVIAEALAKAQNGNIGILSRYGVATRDAAGETLSFDQIMRNANSTFGGSAAKAAETASGKLSILQAKLADTGEEVGTSLIPMVTQGADFIGRMAERFNALSPGLQGFVVKGLLAGAALGPLLSVGGRFVAVGGRMITVAGNIGLAFGRNAATAPAYARGIAAASRSVASHAAALRGNVVQIARQGAAFTLAAAKTAAHTVATIASRAAAIAANAATKAWAAGQWLLNAALSANPIGLVVVAIGALVAAFVVAYKKSETFRRIVDAAFTGIKRVAVAVFSFLAGHIKAWVTTVRTVLSGLSAVARWVVDRFTSIKDGAVNAFKRVVEWARGVPDRIKDAVGNLGKTLYSAGGDLLRGLWSGMQSIAGWLRSKITSFFSDLLPGWAEKALGIESPSRVFANIGRMSGAGLVEGLDASRAMVAAAAARMATAATFGLAGAAPSFAYAGAGGGGGGVVVNVGGIHVSVDGSGLSESQVTTAVRSGVEPALERLAREIRAL